MYSFIQGNITLRSFQNSKIHLLSAIKSKSFSFDYKKIQLKNDINKKNKNNIILSSDFIELFNWSKEDQIFHDIKSLEYASDGSLNYQENQKQKQKQKQNK